MRGLPSILDLAPWDEADYLHRALVLPVSGLPDPEWGPLYSLWYFALSRAWPDPVDLFHGGNVLLISLTTGGTYACFRRMGARPWLALAGASVYLLSLAPHVQPRPTQLALLVVLATLVAASFLRSPWAFRALLGLGLLLAATARPEYFVSFLLVSLLLGAGLAREALAAPEQRPRLLARALGYAGAVVVLLAVLGNPFGNTSNRRFYAFCQHFAVGHVARTHLPVNPWGECARVIRSVFGDVDSLGAAARANPGAFLTHVGSNLARYPERSWRLFFREYGGVSPLPARGPPSREQVGHLALLAAAVGLPVLWLLLRWRALRAALARPSVERMAVATGAVVLPVALSVALIYPREHYLILQGVLVLGLLAALAGAVRASSPSPGWGDGLRAAALAGVLGVAVPDLGQRHAGPPEPARPLTHLVRELRALHLEAHVAPGASIGMLDAQGGLPVYLGPPFRRVPLHARRAGEPLGAFLRRTHVDVVLVDGMLQESFPGDPELQDFLSTPGAFGYAFLPVPGTPHPLAVPSAWAPGLLAPPLLSRPGSPASATPAVPD